VKKAHRLRIELFLLQAIPHLELADWRIELKDEPAMDGADACITPVEGSKLGLLQVSANFFGLTPARQKHVLLHELVHLLVKDVDQAVAMTLPDLLGKPAFHAFYQQYSQHVEVLVDTVAYVVEPLIEAEV
jgi:hypothetical protein